MNEVEKMYSNAGVEAKNKCKSSQCIVTNPHPDWCNKCEGLSKAYPPFTAEKQIELIKFLIQKNFYDERIIRSNFEKTYFYCSYMYDYCESEYFEKFEEALANVFNYFWQDLTEEERKQIKEILE